MLIDDRSCANPERASNSEKKFPLYAEAIKHRITVTVGAGQALYIPAGWWHEVRTPHVTMAVNFWFDASAESRHFLRATLRYLVSPESQLFKYRQMMAEYESRCHDDDSQRRRYKVEHRKVLGKRKLQPPSES